jgi:hypothetical protein
MSMSVLQKAGAAELRHEPFPYIVIRDALPEPLCVELISAYPGLDVLGVDRAANNQRWSYPAHKVAENVRIPQVWRDLIAYHVSRDFFGEIVDLFGADMLRLYPHVFADREALMGLDLGIRDKHTFEEKDLLMDAQISGNTPVRAVSSVKTTHVDSNQKLYTGLLYLRPDDDDSRGGDLEIRRFRPDLSSREFRRRFDGVFVDDRYTELVATVPYEKNVLVMFVNCQQALHGVTVRHPTTHTRLFMNLVGETRDLLFDIPQAWENRARKLPRLVRKRIRKVVGG